MKKFLLSLLALPLLLLSCEKPSTENGKEDIVTLELTSEKELSFEAIGGEGAITYTLTNATNLDPLKAEANDGWVTITEVAETIKFSVAENDQPAERTTKIVVSYNDLQQEVTVNQAATEGDSWSIVGSMNNWDASKAIKMESIEGYYVARNIELTASDSFKFVHNRDMANALGGNGQNAEIDYKYSAMKYGSDIRTGKDGVYDIYLNEALDSYYIMSEGNDPQNAQEALKPGEDAWFVDMLGESVKMRNRGVYVVATDLTLSEDGFKLRNTITGEHGVAEETTIEVGQEVYIVAGAEHNIKANIEAEQKYDIFLKVNEKRVWVVKSGEEPDYVHIGTKAEGAWFDSTNFVVTVYAEGQRITIDCYIDESTEDFKIPEATFSIGGTDGYTILMEGCQVANNNGKAGMISGSITFEHAEEGYDIYLDVVSDIRQNVKIKYSGKIVPYGAGGIYPIVNPSNK